MTPQAMRAALSSESREARHGTGLVRLSNINYNRRFRAHNSKLGSILEGVTGHPAAVDWKTRQIVTASDCRCENDRCR